MRGGHRGAVVHHVPGASRGRRALVHRGQDVHAWSRERDLTGLRPVVGEVGEVAGAVGRGHIDDALAVARPESPGRTGLVAGGDNNRRSTRAGLVEDHLADLRIALALAAERHVEHLRRCGIPTGILAWVRTNRTSPFGEVAPGSPDDCGEDVRARAETARAEGAQVLDLHRGGDTGDADAVVLDRVDGAVDVGAVPGRVRSLG